MSGSSRSWSRTRPDPARRARGDVGEHGAFQVVAAYDTASRLSRATPARRPVRASWSSRRRCGVDPRRRRPRYVDVPAYGEGAYHVPAPLAKVTHQTLTSLVGKCVRMRYSYGERDAVLLRDSEALGLFTFGPSSSGMPGITVDGVESIGVLVLRPKARLGTKAVVRARDRPLLFRASSPRRARVRASCSRSSCRPTAPCRWSTKRATSSASSRRRSATIPMAGSIVGAGLQAVPQAQPSQNARPSEEPTSTAACESLPSRPIGLAETVHSTPRCLSSSMPSSAATAK